MQSLLLKSPHQIAHSRSGKPRVIVDLSFPHGDLVNDGIPTNSYIGTPFTLRLLEVDALISIIRHKDHGCHLFKTDLSRAYRQLRIDPCDFHLLSHRHNGSLYFNVALPFGLHSSAMMFQQTTSAVTYMFQRMGYNCTNYIDDFGGAETPNNSTTAFNALDDLQSLLGLQLLRYVNFCSRNCQRTFYRTYKLCIFELLVEFSTISWVNKASKHGVRIKNRRVTTRCHMTRELWRQIQYSVRWTCTNAANVFFAEWNTNAETVKS